MRSPCSKDLQRGVFLEGEVLTFTKKFKKPDDPWAFEEKYLEGLYEVKPDKKQQK